MSTLNVNGADRPFSAEPDTPLLWVLREQLGLTGTKYGCGIAVCGACTVHIDGDAVRFVRRRVEAPPPEDDGGVTTLHYELEAVRPGAARVTLAPKPASRDAAQPPVVLDVTVRDAAPR